MSRWCAEQSRGVRAQESCSIKSHRVLRTERRVRWYSFAAGLLILSTVMIGAGLAAPASWRTLHQRLRAWDIQGAQQIYMQLGESGSPPALVAEARLKFLSGDYRGAVAALDQLRTIAPEIEAELGSLAATIRATHETLGGMQETLSPDGRFVIRYFERDQLLLPYLSEVLMASDRVYAEDFGGRPEGRILVEIYPEPRYLAAVSSLSEEDIETSGTIALCKYNRLMVTSPRGMARGYDWRDTVAHEFVHYYVTHLSDNTVPIWLHEGIAKFEQSRWRFPPGHPLNPPQEDLLARSLEEDQLITFQQMHPSMAKLPSQSAAALAFAEVHTVIGFLHRRLGYPGIRALIAALRGGADMDAALRTVYQLNLGELWEVWLRDLRGQGMRTWPGLIQQSLRFKRPGQEGELEPEYASIEEKEVKDWAHLGELLRARGRHQAAVFEYQKASTQGGDGHPLVQTGLAASLFELQRYPEVVTALERVGRYYPSHFNIYLYRGEALLAIGDQQGAVEAFEGAVSINPFHPRPHQALVRLYNALGDQERADRERRALEQLQ